MDFVLKRRGGVPVKDQLVAQLELKILGGGIASGEKLPSVRALARRLRIHPNTVSAAYQELESYGHVKLKKGAGVFACRSAPKKPSEAQNLDEMIRLVLDLAFAKGFSGPEIRTAVERWMDSSPPDRVVAVDPSKSMGELLVHEIREALHVPATCHTLEEIAEDPSLLAGTLTVTLPYHAEALTALAPEARVEVMTMQVADVERQAILAIPAGSIVLVVSHSSTVLPFASVLLRSLRGDDFLVETRLLERSAEWRRLLPASDLIFVDALSARALRKAGARKLREFRILSEPVLARLKDALGVVVPRQPGPSRPQAG